MFRNDRQICSAVRVLLQSVRLQHLWTEDGPDPGPTPQAVKLLEDRGGPMSHGEQLMLFVAFDFWNGHGEVKLSELLKVHDNENLRRVATLMIAVVDGADAVDNWIAKNRKSDLPRAR